MDIQRIFIRVNNFMLLILNRVKIPQKEPQITKYYFEQRIDAFSNGTVRISKLLLQRMWYFGIWFGGMVKKSEASLKNVNISMSNCLKW
jgi:hypothetical protein